MGICTLGGDKNSYQSVNNRFDELEVHSLKKLNDEAITRMMAVEGVPQKPQGCDAHSVQQALMRGSGAVVKMYHDPQSGLTLHTFTGTRTKPTRRWSGRRVSRSYELWRFRW
jgi:hypothetical protein